jgi:hypothetical protein
VATRLPLVLADNSQITQLQAGDSLPGVQALAQVLLQNNAILRMLAILCLEQDINPPALIDADIENFYQELTP